jgi:phosphate:Na+ symporter
MTDLVEKAYDVMIENLNLAFNGKLGDIANAYAAEDHINTLRNNLRDAAIEDIDNNNKTYQSSVYFMDIISELERMGDFMINISQSLQRAYVVAK